MASVSDLNVRHSRRSLAFRVNREPVSGVEYTVPGLTNGKEYEFRVAAVNKAGPGDFGKHAVLTLWLSDNRFCLAQTDGAIQARAPDVAPHAVGFGGFTPKEIFVRAGEDLRIPVQFAGSPLPEVTFARGNTDIRPDGNTQVTVNDGVAELLVPKVKVGDSGLYSCTLKNALGQETVQMKITVVDKPGLSFSLSACSSVVQLCVSSFVNRYARRTVGNQRY